MYVTSVADGLQYEGSFQKFGVTLIMCNITNSENIFDTGFLIIRWFDRYSIDIWVWPRYYDIENGNFR